MKNVFCCKIPLLLDLVALNTKSRLWISGRHVLIKNNIDMKITGSNIVDFKGPRQDTNDCGVNSLFFILEQSIGGITYFLWPLCATLKIWFNFRISVFKITSDYLCHSKVNPSFAYSNHAQKSHRLCLLDFLRIF